jgi:hypothetical protein
VDPYTVGFGTSVALSDAFIYAGAPIMSVDGIKFVSSAAVDCLAVVVLGVLSSRRCGGHGLSQGAAYSYNGYVFFPIKPPAYWVPADPRFARQALLIRDMDAFFVNDTFPVHVKTRFDREVSCGCGEILVVVALPGVGYVWVVCEYVRFPWQRMTARTPSRN